MHICLEIFWENHNPTTLNRQGPDVGSQYRSVIFYHSDEQARIARESKQALEKSGKFRQPSDRNRSGLHILSR